MPTVSSPSDSAPAISWPSLAARVLDGHLLTEAEGVAILQSPDDELLELLAAAFRIRRRYFGTTVQLYYLINAKSGLCPEDCSYCSQAKTSEAEIPRYTILDREQLLEGARLASEQQAKSYCIVISARRPSERELQSIEEIVREIKTRYDLKICTSLGLVTPEQAQRLKACGVDRVNHNLNTSRDYYRQICTTHTFQNRLETLRAIRTAGLEICSGGIVGMGEQDLDVVRMALELREIGVESTPVNFLIPIDGTPHAGTRRLDPRYCLKVLAMFRFASPDRELRVAAGRELHLGSLQAMGLYAANAIFVGDYLTTKGQPPEADYRMIADLGFQVTKTQELVLHGGRTVESAT